MKRSYVGRVLAIEMEREDITQAEFAARCAITQPSAWRIMRGHIRLAEGTLQRITHCWSDKAANGRMLIAHLRDEIQRAGYDPENDVVLTWPDGRTAQSLRHQDLDTIREHLSDPDVAELIHDIAGLIERAASHQHTHWPAAAAEQPDDGYLKSPVDKPAPAPQNKKPTKPKE